MAKISITIHAKGCACCGGGGKVRGSQNRDCPTCNGTGKGPGER